MVPHFVVQLRKAVQAGGVFRVVRAQCRAVDLHRLSEEWQGAGVVPLILRYSVARQAQAGGIVRRILAQMLVSQVSSELDGEVNRLV